MRRWLLPGAILLLLSGAAAAGDADRLPGDGAAAGNAAAIGFLSAPQAGAVHASALLGAPLYAAEDAAGGPSRRKLGVVGDLLLAPEGGIHAALVDVGPYTGARVRTLAIPFGALRILPVDEGGPGLVLLMPATRDMLRQAPPYEQPAKGVAALPMTRASGMPAAAGGSAPPLAAGPAGAPAILRDGYRHAAAGELTARMLRNAEVYGPAGDRVGAIRSVEVTDSGIITGVVIDIGGLLGMGGRAVALPFSALTVLRRDGGDTLRIHVDQTRERLDALPRHKG